MTPAGFVVREVLRGISQTELQARSGARLDLCSDCRPLTAPAIADTDPA